MKKFLKIVINLILITIIAYCGYNIYIKLKDYKQAEIIYNDIKKKKKEDLSNINNDFRFWLEVDNTNIEYPVVQGIDNYFYLKKDIYKNYLSSGSIFMDYRNNFKTDKNIIIYGHNMKNKTMFNNLEKFKEKEFFNQNNKIRIFDKDKKYIYEVFSAYYVDPNYNYIIPNFDNKEEYISYLENIKNKSLFKSNININSDDKIITLSTCSYETQDTRTVVHGKLIEIK